MAIKNLALVIGSAGQDGHYLCRQLQQQGYALVEVDTSTVSVTGRSLALPPSLDLLDRDAVRGFVGTLVDLRLMFFLAAYHHSSDESHDAEVPELFRRSFSVHVDAWINLLDAVVRFFPECRSFYAASSHIFGHPTDTIQDENSAIRPTNAYGISKAAGLEVARYFRRLGRHTSVGILYNHESERRDRKFVSQRIAYGAVQALAAKRRGLPYSLELGALDAIVDWGYAPDYTRAMLHIVKHDVPDDYIVASGEPHTVAQYCDLAFGAVGLDWRDFVVERPQLMTRPTAPLVGNAAKVRALGWAPSVTFDEMVKLMVQAAARRVQTSP